MPSQDTLRETFLYNPTEGYLINKVNRGRARTGGRLCCQPCGRGYLRTKVFGRRIYIHQLIWIYHHGAIPHTHQIDHIDRNRLNNHIENLRLVTPEENYANRGSYGKLGVFYDRTTHRWIFQDGQRRCTSSSLEKVVNMLRGAVDQL